MMVPSVRFDAEQMTIRDQFAAFAMIGLAARSGGEQGNAKIAYRIADQMMKERTAQDAQRKEASG